MRLRQITLFNYEQWKISWKISCVKNIAGYHPGLAAPSAADGALFAWWLFSQLGHDPGQPLAILLTLRWSHRLRRHEKCRNRAVQRFRVSLKSRVRTLLDLIPLKLSFTKFVVLNGQQRSYEFFKSRRLADGVAILKTFVRSEPNPIFWIEFYSWLELTNRISHVTNFSFPSWSILA